jgi:hypothetical protein
MGQELLKKIKDLFKYRGFPELYEISNLNKDIVENLNNQLIDLQANIYYLDSYLEENWTLKENELNQYWKNIHQSLSVLGVKKSDWMDYTNHILKYQKHEMELRLGLMPTRLNMEYFYFYKSCDVKLIRRLLMEKLPNVSKLCDAADWRYFDLVTEINDDAMDIEEDLSTINGNRVLISIQLYGAKETIKIFSNFLKTVEQKSIKRFTKVKSEYKKKIHQMTLEQITATKKLLLENVNKFSVENDSMLSKYLMLKKIA